MACSDKWKIDKIDKFFVCLILIFLCLFEFCNTFVFADELEVVDVSTANGITINPSYNYFTESIYSYVHYFKLDKGYIYHIKNNSEFNRFIVLCDDVPSLNLPYNLIYTLAPGDTYNYYSSDDNLFIYLSTSAYLDDVTREKVPGIDSAITDLVDNVGISQLWSIFDVSVPFILVVVVVAIGVFLIISFIKKGSKGKSGF